MDPVVNQVYSWLSSFKITVSSPLTDVLGAF